MRFSFFYGSKHTKKERFTHIQKFSLIKRSFLTVGFGVPDDGENLFPIMGNRNGDSGGIDEGDMNYNDGSDDFHS